MTTSVLRRLLQVVEVPEPVVSSEDQRALLAVEADVLCSTPKSPDVIQVQVARDVLAALTTLSFSVAEDSDTSATIPYVDQVQVHAPPVPPLQSLCAYIRDMVSHPLCAWSLK